jgi:nitrate/TMAO reductase-like tetraheme cytochrome c subunit
MNPLPLAVALPETSTVVKVLGTLLGLAGILLCWRVLRVRPSDLTDTKVITFGVLALPAVAFYKLLAFLGLIVAPAGLVAVANYNVFERATTVEGCASCHIMRPMVNDMRDPHSDTLAARHFRNKWIAQDQCYHCHTDYGLSGTLSAKAEGYRDLVRYVTGTYNEPIRLRGHYLNGICLNCHDGTARFDAVPSHQTVGDRLRRDAMDCLNCHGLAHPASSRRTPGSPDYERLMREEDK